MFYSYSCRDTQCIFTPTSDSMVLSELGQVGNICPTKDQIKGEYNTDNLYVLCSKKQSSALTNLIAKLNLTAG